LQDENYKKKKPRLNGHSTKYKKLLGPKKNGHKKWNEDGNEFG
jgi:esterase/lipase